MIGYFSLSLLLSISVLASYIFAYRILWYELSKLIELPSSSSRGYLSTGPTDWNLRFMSTGSTSLKSTFLLKLRSQYAISSRSLTRLVRMLFSLSVTLYILTIEIVLIQILLASSSEDTCYLCAVPSLWASVTFPALTVILLFLQPFCILNFLLEKFFGTNLTVGKLLGLNICVLSLLFGLLRSLSFGPFSQTSNALTGLSVVGVGLMSVLSGIAAMSTIYYTAMFLYYRFYYGNHHSTLPLECLINAGGIDISGIWADKRQIEQTLVLYNSSIEETVRALNNIRPYDLGASFNSSHEREILLERISRYQIRANKLNDLLKHTSVTRVGRRYFALVYLLYCVYNMGLTFFIKIPAIVKYHSSGTDDLAFAKLTKTTDPLAVTLANLLDKIFFHFNHQHDLTSLTREISLLLSLSLFVLSLSTAHRTISLMQTLLPAKLRILDMFDADKVEMLPRYEGLAYSKTVKPPSLIKNLVVSEIVGIYIMAAIVMIRSNLPPDISGKLVSILGEGFYLGNMEIERWFCQIYAVSCILTFCFIRLIGYKRQMFSRPFIKRHRATGYL